MSNHDRASLNPRNSSTSGTSYYSPRNSTHTGAASGSGSGSRKKRSKTASTSGTDRRTSTFSFGMRSHRTQSSTESPVATGAAAAAVPADTSVLQGSSRSAHGTVGSDLILMGEVEGGHAQEGVRRERGFWRDRDVRVAHSNSAMFQFMYPLVTLPVPHKLARHACMVQLLQDMHALVTLRPQIWHRHETVEYRVTGYLFVCRCVW